VVGNFAPNRHKLGVLPSYLTVSAAELGRGQPVQVHVCGNGGALAGAMADAMLHELIRGREEDRGATLIVPVGPVDQFPILARHINERRICCRRTVLINMDEYLSDDGTWIPETHPLSFRAFMKRNFYDLLDASLAPAVENRVFPDPRRPEAIQQIIDARGGVDACFGGIGINGHIAFNEPPEDENAMSPGMFAALPSRVVALACATRTINSVTVGGEISIVPNRAVTVGMKEILASRRLRFYCNRPWQSAVVRRVLHGPITAACPASLLRTHPDAQLWMADYVAAEPDIRLR